MLLADLGAEVVKVEQPQEDALGAAGISVEGLPSYWLSINRNKKTIAIDMRSPEGKKKIWELIEKAEIVYENFRPGVMERLGIGWEELQKRKPSIVLASIS